MKASFHKHILRFRKPAGTSRGVLTEKPAYFIALQNPDTGYTALGECGMLPGLSADDRPHYESMLASTVEALNSGSELPDLLTWPSIALGVETARLNYHCGKTGMVFPSRFSNGNAGIPINGLVWMGTAADMRRQIDEKIKAGFRCIKLKIGAIDFALELDLLAYIRKRYPADIMEIRVDANGAFAPEEAEKKLNQLAPFQLHSIEQPIRQGRPGLMAELCRNSPVPVALDEELIGHFDPRSRRELIETIRPQAIVLKPAFLGPFAVSDEWIGLAEEIGAKWWITSALESNVGLNAIAQYTFTRLNDQYQGLGTGALYLNNADSPLYIKSGALHCGSAPWKFPFEP